MLASDQFGLALWGWAHRPRPHACSGSKDKADAVSDETSQRVCPGTQEHVGSPAEQDPQEARGPPCSWRSSLCLHRVTREHL